VTAQDEAIAATLLLGAGIGAVLPLALAVFITWAMFAPVTVLGFPALRCQRVRGRRREVAAREHSDFAQSFLQKLFGERGIPPYARAMSDGERKRVLDPERDAAALKALTHPLRIRLLGLLRQHGPATATELAEGTGESSASTSYHLRVLAKHGFVAEAEARDGRERRWRAMHEITSWSNAAMGEAPEQQEFLDVMRRAQITHLERSLVQHDADMAAGLLGPEWREGSGMTDLMPRLTPQSLVELWEAFEAKIEELTARDADDERARHVVVFGAGLPLAQESPARKKGS
jgi:DNA-binding transcriptional ArsR family regulator